MATDNDDGRDRGALPFDGAVSCPIGKSMSHKKRWEGQELKTAPRRRNHNGRPSAVW